jgi:opacity protein-like surface antigen
MQQAAKMKAQRKTLISAGVIAIAWCSTCAYAADIAVKAPAYQTPVAPAFSWTGFYFGGHFGYIWGRTEVDVSDATVTPGGATNGIAGGVIGGGNWQFGSYVLGVEGREGAASQKGTMQPHHTPPAQRPEGRCQKFAAVDRVAPSLFTLPVADSLAGSPDR